MKKFVTGIIIGILLATAFPAYGAVSSLVGKKITREVKVTMLGETLEKKAILLEGVTYVPLRVITEKLGLQAEFVNGDVVVRNKSDELIQVENKITAKTADVKEAMTRVENGKKQIQVLEQRIIDEAGKTDYFPGFSPAEQLERTKLLLNEAEQQLANLRSELAELEKQKADLEAKAGQ